MSNNNKRVLLLADDEIFASFHNLIGRVLNDLGFEVQREMACTPKIQNYVKDSKPQMIIVDPLVKGFEQRDIECMKSLENDGEVVFLAIQNFANEFNLTDLSIKIHGSIFRYFSPDQIASVINAVQYPSNLNRRRHQRAIINLPVAYGPEGVAVPNISSESFDLSAGGAFIRAYSPPSVGDRVTVRVFFPETDEVANFIGRVTYCRPFQPGLMSLFPAGMGIEIEEISEEDRQQICNYVDSTRKEQCPVLCTKECDSTSCQHPNCTEKSPCCLKVF